MGTERAKVSLSAYHTDSFVSKSAQSYPVTQFYLNLPWELRHHISTFCVQGYCDNEVLVRQGSESQSRLFVRQPVGTHSYRWIEDPIFVQFSPERVGSAVSQEVLETYYRTRTFKFGHGEIGCVAPFLEQCSSDPSSSSHPIANIRRLHLQIQLFKYAQIRELEAMRSELDLCCQALKCLVAIQNPQAVISVHLNLAEGNVEDEEDKEVLLNSAATLMLHLISLVDMLRRRGLNIKLMLQGRWDEEEGAELYGPAMTSFDNCLTTIKASSLYISSRN